MIPVGYMAKRVSLRPEGLKAERVEDIFSVSGCVSKCFADYLKYCMHNGYWFFDSPEIIRRLAHEHSIDLAGTSLFFYEVHELEFADTTGRWMPFEPEGSFQTHVTPPTRKVLEGYDVVTFHAGTDPECSPLSCNYLAAHVETSRHCLLPSLERAQQLLREGIFKNTEPGPFRVFAVYSTEWPTATVDGAGRR
ncbi:MAG: hypothetical protein HZA54_05470 [Planctomycetes bacterium]|nr:hypothetical protein [Planctomycetota bacterium]